MKPHKKGNIFIISAASGTGKTTALELLCGLREPTTGQASPIASHLVTRYFSAAVLVEDAIARRADQELGTAVTALRLVDRDFRYRAVDASGIVENEICPVFVARPLGTLRPDPDEVAEHAWADVADVWSLVANTPWAVSPWFVEQVQQLPSDDPGSVYDTHPVMSRVSNS